VPVVFLLVTVWLIINTLMTAPVQTMIGLGLMLLGLPVYSYWSRGAEQRAPDRE
jgi:APA family basic amino acid/polyamine antiporter